MNEWYLFFVLEYIFRVYHFQQLQLIIHLKDFSFILQFHVLLCMYTSQTTINTVLK